LRPGFDILDGFCQRFVQNIKASLPGRIEAMSDVREFRLVSWNVNGLRAVMKKDPSVEGIIRTFDADVFALQETKISFANLAEDAKAKDRVALDLPGYHQTWNCAEKKGYSGTAVFSKEEPLQVIRQIGCGVADDEGRVCALEFEKFWFVDVYTPNAQDGLKRIDVRLEWDEAYRDFLSGLALQKPVITCGDFNVAHEEIDLKNPGPNRGNAGFSDEERGKMTELLGAGFTDTFRWMYPEQVTYSWWSYRFRAREKNAGWRIDYFIISDRLREKVEDAVIHTDIMGSDHCPVSLMISL
jgi:exodeoxyribonuclease-3